MGQVHQFVPATRLGRLEAALSDLREGELYTLITLTHLGPREPRAVFKWIEAACDWELDRRIGWEYRLAPPGAVIAADEAAVSLKAAKELRLRYGAHSLAMRSMFEAMIDMLGSGGR